MMIKRWLVWLERDNGTGRVLRDERGRELTFRVKRDALEAARQNDGHVVPVWTPTRRGR